MGGIMKLQYFTYFLNPLQQGQLFEDKRDKAEILRGLLRTGEIKYSSGGMNLAFVVLVEKDNYFVGRLGKKASIKRSLTPEEKFADTNEENWPHCTVIINTNTNPDSGQRIVFE